MKEKLRKSIKKTLLPVALSTSLLLAGRTDCTTSNETPDMTGQPSNSLRDIERYYYQNVEDIKIGVVFVNFKGPLDPIERQLANDAFPLGRSMDIFDDRISVEEYFNTSSNGKVDLTFLPAGIVDLSDMSSLGSCSKGGASYEIFAELVRTAEERLEEKGSDTSSYNKLVFITDVCTNSDSDDPYRNVTGRAYIGGREMVIYNNMDVNTIIHELGHLEGLEHTGLLSTGEDGSTKYHPNLGIHDLMGYIGDNYKCDGNPVWDFNIPQKIILGWENEEDIERISTSGEYVLESSQSYKGVKALIVKYPIADTTKPRLLDHQDYLVVENIQPMVYNWMSSDDINRVNKQFSGDIVVYITSLRRGDEMTERILRLTDLNPSSYGKGVNIQLSRVGETSTVYVDMSGGRVKK